MIKYVCFGFILFLNSCIAIKRTETRKVDDGYASITAEDATFISDFSGIEGATKLTPDRFEYINAEQLKSIAAKHTYTIAVIWASWCPVCHTYLPKLNTWKDSIQTMNKNIGIVLIEQNINVKYSQTLIRQFKYPYQSYIIDSRIYGTNELTKQDKFFKELDPKSSTKVGAVPITVLLDSNGKIVSEFGGKKWSFSDMMAKMNF